MRLPRLTAFAMTIAMASALPAVADPIPDPTTTEADDAVVIAVVDSGFSPYHLDFRADLMPQHLDGDPSNDLPLDTDPADWLPGYADAVGVASTGAIDLTLTTDTSVPIEQLEDADNAHDQLPQSSNGDVHMRHIPGTKIVGALDFGGGTDGFFGANNSHGNGTSTVSAGTIHGTCPECLVVLIRYGGDDREAASNWAMNQPWIDVVTNSFGFSTLMRDRIYAGSDTDLQRQASERGQTIFFSAGNGQANAFVAPNTTYQSSQEGPDWIITVGATDTDGREYTGTGKAADISSIGTGYPAGYGGATINGSGNFSGTSNATPVAAGTYARALYDLRAAMAGPSRIQRGGVISVGAMSCGSAVADCAVADSEVDATEMRFGFLHAASQTDPGLRPGQVGVTTPAVDEVEYASEGHGTLFGRLPDNFRWLEEVAAVVEPLTGVRAPLDRPQAEHDWFVVDSWCRQEIHGGWDGGYWVEGETELPTVSGPLTTAMATACPTVFGALNALGTDDAADGPEQLDRG